MGDHLTVMAIPKFSNFTLEDDLQKISFMKGRAIGTEPKQFGEITALDETESLTYTIPTYEDKFRGGSDGVREDSNYQEMTIDELIEMHEKERERHRTLDPVQSEDRMTVGNLTEGLCLIEKERIYGQTKSAKKQWRTESAHRRKNCPAYCVLIGRSRSTQKVGVENGLGRSENKRPETRRSWN
ncbi:hypothetical protein TNCV_163821 [Trichonephila clavipes]|nr:hypothetical protein TNCV_163821 [Trichonephila clavipes]